MIAGLAALAYLEYRQIVNRIRETLRAPGRAIMYLLAIAYFAVVGFIRYHGHRAPGLNAIPEPYASALLFAYVTLAGILMYGAASGIVGAFSSSADARFLSGSLIPPRLVVMWLQLRRSGVAIARMIFTILLYTLIFSSSGTFSGIGLAMLGGTVIVTGSAIPMLKLRRITGTRTAQSLAGAIAAIGILPMTILFASLAPGAPAAESAQAIEHFGAGYAFNALFEGNYLALAALYVFGACVIALAYVTGEGLFPDLYASSLRVLEFQERQRRGSGSAFSMEHRYEQRDAKVSHRIFSVFSGAWTIAWKEWIAFVRAPAMRRMFVFGLVMCAAAGAFFGYSTGGAKDRLQETIGFTSMAGMMITIFVAMGSAIGLAGDISKPLWWMGRDPLWMRLLAWIAGTSWRMAACIGIGIVAWGATLHAPIIALTGIPIAIAVVLYLRAVGLALYSLFPSTIDQRGPLAMVRALLTYILGAPPGFAALIVLLTLHSLAGAIAAGILCSLLETLLLVTFASARIAGKGIAFARAEAT